MALDRVNTSNMYNGGIGFSTLQQHSVASPFGSVVTSGGFTRADGAIPTYNSYGSTGWGVASFNNGTGTSVPTTAVGGGVASGSSAGGGGSSSPLSPDVQAGQHYQSAIDWLQQGVANANKAVANSTKHIDSADADLSTARDSAASITNSINAINSSAMALSPYVQFFDEQGRATSGIGTSILNNDKSAGGLAAEFLESIGMAGDAALNITPDRYVSMAASDVQSSYNNAYQQMLRGMGRTGASLNSGNASALQRLYAQSLATALAAAKTKARQTGINEQLNALTARAGLYKDALTTGAALQKQGEESVAQAAGIVQKQGDMFAMAGNLSNTQTNAFANIGGVEVNLGQLELQNNQAVQNALKDVADAQQAMAQFYAGQQMDVQFSFGTDNFKTSISKKQ